MCVWGTSVTVLTVHHIRADFLRAGAVVVTITPT